MYVKGEGKKDPFQREKVTKELEFKHIHVAKIISEHYTKIEGKLSTRLFVIISGGTKRERQYFSILQNNQEKFNRIRLEFVSDEASGLTTTMLLATARSIKAKLIDSISEDEDVFYLLSDRDHYYPELCTISPICSAESFNLIISNPCFEIWLYYGYFGVKPTQNGFTNTNIHQISSEFKHYLHLKTSELGMGGADPRKAIFKIKTAIENAEKNYFVDSNGIPEVYSTNMHLLAVELIKQIETDLEIIENEIAHKEKKYKK